MNSDLEAIRLEFAEPITYDPPGKWAVDRAMQAVYCNEPAPDALGAGNTGRTVWFEIAYGDMTQRPSKAGDLIAHSTGNYRVIQVTDRDDISSWEVVVERAA